MMQSFLNLETEPVEISDSELTCVSWNRPSAWKWTIGDEGPKRFIKLSSRADILFAGLHGTCNQWTNCTACSIIWFEEVPHHLCRCTGECRSTNVVAWVTTATSSSLYGGQLWLVCCARRHQPVQKSANRHSYYRNPKAFFIRFENDIKKRLRLGLREARVGYIIKSRKIARRKLRPNLVFKFQP